MLAALLGALSGAFSPVQVVSQYQPSLTPISFDPEVVNESFLSVDSLLAGAGTEIADSRVHQAVLGSDEVTGRPTSVRVVTSLAGVADTSARTQAWVSSSMLRTLATTFQYPISAGFNLPLSLALASDVAGSRVSQTLSLSSGSILKANVVARDTATLDAQGHPTELVLWIADTAQMSTKLLSGTALTLLPALRSATEYVGTYPFVRAVKSWNAGAWKNVDSSWVSFRDGVPVLVTRMDSAGLHRDSLVWKDGRLAERFRGDSVVSFAYDLQGRLVRRQVSVVAGELRIPVRATRWSYDLPSALQGRGLPGFQLSVASSGNSRTALLRLPKSALVRVSVHSVDGRQLGLLADGQLPAGISSFSLNGIRGAAVVKAKGSGFSATASVPGP